MAADLPMATRTLVRFGFNPDALAQRISFATGIGQGRSPLAAVIDDTVDNDPYAGGAPRDPVALRATPRRRIG